MIYLVSALRRRNERVIRRTMADGQRWTQHELERATGMYALAVQDALDRWEARGLVETGWHGATPPTHLCARRWYRLRQP
jgi:DNA-binding GntR family transcriptional regulator